jgi:hypothetical protein
MFGEEYKKVELPLYLIKHHAIKMHDGVGMQ